MKEKVGEVFRLAEHAAPGEALVFALDGEAVIGYKGKEYSIKAGDNFQFAKDKGSRRFHHKAGLA